MTAQSLAQIMQPTHDDLWKVFSTVRTFPTPMTQVMREAQVDCLGVYGALAQLEEDGLIVVHCEQPLEWRLADA